MKENIICSSKNNVQHSNLFRKQISVRNKIIIRRQDGLNLWKGWKMGEGQSKLLGTAPKEEEIRREH